MFEGVKAECVYVCKREREREREAVHAFSSSASSQSQAETGVQFIKSQD